MTSQRAIQAAVPQSGSSSLVAIIAFRMYHTEVADSMPFAPRRTWESDEQPHMRNNTASQASKCTFSGYLCFVSQELEGHWIGDLEGQSIEGKGSLVKLEIHSHILHCQKIIKAATGCTACHPCGECLSAKLLSIQGQVRGALQ